MRVVAASTSNTLVVVYAPNVYIFLTEHSHHYMLVQRVLGTRLVCLRNCLKKEKFEGKKKEKREKKTLVKQRWNFSSCLALQATYR
jgi:hypothetical protein